MKQKKNSEVSVLTAGGDHGAHSSEYESIDPNLFNRFKAKIRRSQIRKYNSNGGAGGHMGDVRMEDGHGGVYYIPR